MDIQAVVHDLIESSPSVHLIEAEAPHRYLVVPIALPEAMALQHAIMHIDGRRPGTHELFIGVLRRLQSDVICARIVRRDAGVYYAEIDVMTPTGRETFDARVSDALVLCRRQRVPAPILCDVSILES
jgi:bifunctional DNase/RNase